MLTNIKEINLQRFDVLKCLYKELGKNMRISSIKTYQSNPTYKAVNQKYLEWAKRDIRLNEEVTTEWMRRLSYDVNLFKEISLTDAIDTLEAVKKITPKIDIILEEALDIFKSQKP